MYVTISTPLGMVTILILVDGFLQFGPSGMFYLVLIGHNPYFSRWFSAILILNY